MVDQQLWAALREATQRRHDRSFTKVWPLVTQELKKIDGTLDGRNVQDEPALISLAADASIANETRARVCWILGRAGIRAAIETLLGVASDNAADLRAAAIHVLGKLEGQRALTVLPTAAQTDPEPEVRYEAVYSLQNFDGKRSADVLLSVFNNHNELPSVRGQAAESLANLGYSRSTKRAVPALRQALAEPSAEIRFWSAYALGYLGTAEVFEDLERLFDDSAVVEPFGSVGDEARTAIETIRQFTQSRSGG
jgi:HEAT repeat protein